MAGTATLGLWSPDGTDDIDEIVPDLAAMQTSTEAAILATRGMIVSPTVASAAARDALYPAPAQGNRVFRSDVGWEETYYALYNAGTNPGGVTPAGWYPTGGNMPRIAVSRITDSAAGSGTWTDWNWTTAPVIKENRGGFTLNATKIMVPYHGWYDVSFYMMWAAAAQPGERYQRIITDAASPWADTSGIDRLQTTAGANVFRNMDSTVTAETFITVGAYHTTTDNANLNISNPRVVIQFKGPKQS